MFNHSVFLSSAQYENNPSLKIQKNQLQKTLNPKEQQASTMHIKKIKRQSLKTEDNYKESLEKQRTKLTFLQQNKCGIKFYPQTYRPGLLRAFEHLNQVILVYLIYKQQKISIFLNNGVTFEELLKRLYKEIYIFEKQCYSISNAILKNLLFKITGFQSIDGDLMLDYKLKYKKGTLTKQKIFAPFMQEDMRMPFKLYGLLCDLPYGGNQFLARNYSDGNWTIVSSIKKCLIGEEKVAQIKKYLKSTYNACSLLMKNSSSHSHFSQINWIETKNNLLAVSKFFPQNLEQNIEKNRESYKKDEIEQIFIYFAKWLAQAFKQLVNFNIKNFKRLWIRNISLNPDNNLPIISIADNLIDSIEFIGKKNNNPIHSSRVVQNISDCYYFETYCDLLTELKSLFGKQIEGVKVFEEFYQYLNQQETQNKFSFDSVIKYFQEYDKKQTSENRKIEEKLHPLSIDLTSKFQSIVQNLEETKKNHDFASHQKFLISQIKEEIHEAYSIQNMLKNKHKIQSLKILMMMSTSRFSELKNQHIVNLLEFKKQEERKSHLKTQEKLYIHEIINEINQNQHFIKTTKQNNLASIEFYLQKSDFKLKKQITNKIQNKYKKFLEKKQNSLDDSISTGMNKKTFKKQGSHLKKIFFEPQSKQQDVSILHTQSTKLSSLKKVKSQQNVFEMNYSENYGFKNEQYLKSAQLSQSILEKQSTSQSLQRSTFRNIYRNATVQKTKTQNFLSFNIKEKKHEIQQLLVNKKEFKKQDKVQLKRKHYGIYLEQAEKQYNKIKALRKNPILHPLKK